MFGHEIGSVRASCLNCLVWSWLTKYAIVSKLSDSNNFVIVLHKGLSKPRTLNEFLSYFFDIYGRMSYRYDQTRWYSPSINTRSKVILFLALYRSSNVSHASAKLLRPPRSLAHLISIDPCQHQWYLSSPSHRGLSFGSRFFFLGREV